MIELIGVAQAGGNLEVDARQYSADEMLALARALNSACVLKLAYSESKSTKDLASIVSGAPGKIILA